MPNNTYSGLIAAPFTPFNEDGELNLAVVADQADRLVGDGVSGVFVCGTTGEGLSLTLAERKAVVEAWAKALGQREEDVLLIVHVGHLCLPDAMELAAHAEEFGADAIAAHAPCFFKPTDAEDVVEWCATIASAAPETDFFYYQIPSLTGVAIPVAEIVPLAMEEIPNFAGVKFTHDDVADFAAAVTVAAGRVTMLWGRDEMLTAGLQAGADGAVGSTYNFATPHFTKLMDAVYAEDEVLAGELQKQARDFIGVLGKYGTIPAAKAVMAMVGVDCGLVRLPLRGLDEETEDELKADLSAVGFFDL